MPPMHTVFSSVCSVCSSCVSKQVTKLSSVFTSGWDKRGKDHHQAACDNILSTDFSQTPDMTMLIMTTMMMMMMMVMFFVDNDDHEERGPSGRPDLGYSDEMLSTGSTITALLMCSLQKEPAMPSVNTQNNIDFWS